MRHASIPEVHRLVVFHAVLILDGRSCTENPARPTTCLVFYGRYTAALTKINLKDYSLLNVQVKLNESQTDKMVDEGIALSFIDT